MLKIIKYPGKKENHPLLSKQSTVLKYILLITVINVEAIKLVLSNQSWINLNERVR